MQEKARQLLQDTPLTEGVKSITLQEEDISADAARKLAQVLSEDPQAEVTIYYPSGGRMNYVLASGSEVKVSCRERIKAINERLGGRGGGKDNFAQGSAEVR